MYIVEVRDEDTSFYVGHTVEEEAEAYKFAVEMSEMGYEVLQPERIN